MGERKIENITFLDKEMPRDIEGERSIIYDVLCETETGEKIIVEMQNQRQPFFKQRSIFYASEAISRQARKGREWRFDIKAVYLIAFLNFTLEDIGTTFRTDVALLDMRTKEVFSDKIRLIYLQLPYFNKEADECENDFERWIYVLKNMEALNRMPFAAKDSVFAKIAEIADISALSKEERMKYDEGIRKFRDTICVMDYNLEKGRKEGIYEVARNLLAMGLPKTSIMQATGLNKDEIDNL